MTDNELIAQFMDTGNAGTHRPLYAMTINGKAIGYYHPDTMLYNTSWDWLMPVVEKIEGNVDYEVDIANGICTISAPDNSLSNSFTNVIVCVHFPEAESKIGAVYKAVAKFIQWYNLHN